ncbi:hypothetical protein EVA_13794 [gut metagenome]|uniref:Uncharacterized protein n=1 Tax=gut metagenome TaxID=749906 RepID=J9FUB6_9ZZZZ
MSDIGVSLYSRQVFLLALAVLIDICIKFYNMRKKHCICSSVWDMEHRSKLMCHTVGDSKSCCIKG